MNENNSIKIVLLTFFCLSTVALFGKSCCNLLDREGQGRVEGGRSCLSQRINGIGKIGGNPFYTYLSASSVSWVLQPRKPFQRKNKTVDKKRFNVGLWLWLLLGLLSVVGLISLDLIFGLPTLGITWLIFLTLATGIGFLLSERKKKGEKSSAPKSFFIASIILNGLVIFLHFIKRD